MARAAPKLDVGCHIVLVDGAPVSPLSQVPSLLDPRTGSFRKSFSEFATTVNRLSANEIEIEVAAQIRKLQQARIVVSHVDAHKHIHVFPHVLAPLLRAAKACGVAAVRAPFDWVRVGQIAKRPGLWKRAVAAWGFRRYGEGFRRAVQAAGMTAPDGCLGIVATGALDEQLFATIVNGMPEGTWEFVCHPGYVDEQLRGVRTRLVETRARELAVLTSPEAPRALTKRGVTLISFKEFAEQAVK